MGYVLIKGSEAQRHRFREPFHNIGILQAVIEIKDQARERDCDGLHKLKRSTCHSPQTCCQCARARAWTRRRGCPPR